jgi:SulP family sulfate permease
LKLPPLRWHRFEPRSVAAIRGATRGQLLKDVSAGITVAVVALPLAMAFAIASGVKPEQGLITAIVGGFLISALGGSNVQIGGPAGAFIVIVYGIAARYGLTNLLIATALSGVLLLLMGALRLGVLVRYLPVGIIVGFTNGIAVLIAMSQLKDLLGLRVSPWPADFFAQWRALIEHAPSIQPAALAMGLACFALVAIWPKSYAPAAAQGAAQHWRERTRVAAAHVPGTVIALVAATAATAMWSLPLETIGSRFGGIPQTLPQLSLPAFSWESAKQLIGPTLTLTLLGAVESLLCARVADNVTELPRHDPNQELMAQGVANMVVPLFGGIPATGTMARTMTNIRSGASTPLAGMVHALALLLIVVVGAPLAAHVPLAALAGILLFVAWNMGEWHEFARLRRFKPSYRTIMLGTFVLTVVFDLTVAVEVGLLLACVFFIMRMSELFRIEPASVPHAPDGVVVMRLYGSLFFGAVAKVEHAADDLPTGTRAVVLEMHQLVSMDTTGLDALHQLHRTLARQGVALVLCALNEQPAGLVERSGFGASLGAGHRVQTLGEAFALARQQARSQANCAR